MKKLMYFPWCDEEMIEMGKRFKEGHIPYLDIELTARCSLGTCIYCDSPINKTYKELNKTEFYSLANNALNQGLKWIYFCGLGEPTDCEYFSDILDFCILNKVKISFFCNGQNLNSELIDKLILANASILIKLDSFYENIFDELLGKRGAASKTYKIIAELEKKKFSNVRHLGDQYVTNLAFSIVPTTKNINEIPEIVSYALNKGIFPSIGELEFANKGKNQFDVLHVDKANLLKLKKSVNDIFGETYQRPVCPAVLYSLHLDVNARCVVDNETGLSCPWFKLGDPEFGYIGNARQDSVDTLRNNMILYRKNRLGALKKVETHAKTFNIFSGCGGRLSDIKRLCIDSFVSDDINKKLEKQSIDFLLLRGKSLFVLPVDHPLGVDTPNLLKKGLKNFINEVSNLPQDAYIIHSRDFPEPPENLDRPYFLTVGEEPDNYLFPIDQIDKYVDLQQVAIYFQIKDKYDNRAIDFYKDYIHQLKLRNIKVLGMGFPVDYVLCNYYQHIADVAHEIGCDYFKTSWSPYLNSLNFYGMTLFIGGGKYMDDQSFKTLLKECTKIKNSNVSIGRNVFEDENPSYRIFLIKEYFS
jgi:MoaA/NifB/PqqE/SkfB family radical SAM enzyme